MRRIAVLVPLAPLTLAFGVGGCSPGDRGVALADPERPPEQAAAQSAPLIDVAPGASLSLALRGGAGPQIAGQSVTHAMVMIEEVRLEGADVAPVILLEQPTMVDLVAIDNQLDQLIAGVDLGAARFSSLRVRMSSAFIQTVDASGVVHTFASEELSEMQVEGAIAGPLELAGLAPDGFITVDLPPTGLEIGAATTVAMHFDLAESITVRRDGVWLLRPTLRALDARYFSMLDVRFEAAAFAEYYEEYSFESFDVVLLDAYLRPVSIAPLVPFEAGIYGSTFQYLDAFEGPFVAVLLPPPGIVLEASVAVSVDLRVSIHAETRISIQSVSVVGRREGAVVLDLAPAPQAAFVERTFAGEQIVETTRSVGDLRAIAPQAPPPARPLPPTEILPTPPTGTQPFAPERPWRERPVIAARSRSSVTTRMSVRRALASGRWASGCARSCTS